MSKREDFLYYVKWFDNEYHIRITDTKQCRPIHKFKCKALRDIGEIAEFWIDRYVDNLDDDLVDYFISG